MPRELFSSVDTAWLRMEVPTNLMMVNGVLILGAPLNFQRLKATLEHRLLDHFDRFRQRVVRPQLPIGPHYWEDDPDFHLDNHVTRIALSSRSSQAALQDVVSELMSTPLDFSRPLWHFHVIEKFGKGSVIIARVHHCIADGIALVHVLLSLTDKSPNAPWPTAQPKEMPRPDWLGALFKPVQPALKITTRAARTLWREGDEILANPSHLRDLTRLGRENAMALGRLVLRWPDPPTLFKGELGTAKRAAWSKPIPLQDVKEVGRMLNGTVNDVLLTAVAGALRSYMLDRGDAADGISIRAVVPVNLRPLDVTPDLGNRFGLVFLTLPVGVPDPMDRLRELKRCMDELKSSPEPAVALGLLSLIGAVPPKVQDMAMGIFAAKATAVMTNVPGPKEKLYLAGAPLDTLMFWVPQSGRLGLGVSIFSYAGRVWLGVATDQGLAPDPEVIIAAFHAEFNTLSRVARRKQAKRSKAIRPMATALDRSVHKVDRLLRDSQSASAGPENTQAGCRAKTRAGQMCKNHPLPGSDYCRIHQR